MNELLYLCPKERSCKRKHGCGHDFPHRVKTVCSDSTCSHCPPCVEFKDIVWVYYEVPLEKA